MAARPTYIFDGQLTTVAAVAEQFTAYGEGLIREGLRAGHNTHDTLLVFLVERHSRAMTAKRRPKGLKPMVYSRKLTGG